MRIAERAKAWWAFALAASAAPTSYLIAMPCGGGCAGCPMGGGCFLAYPILIALAIGAKSVRFGKGLLRRRP
ncbi:MAG: hypothetical protein H5T32_06405 [Candidatus Methanosuratus sp.]|nr:hypothetical protein [Candidatus Methanosuratincola sp.]